MGISFSIIIIQGPVLSQYQPPSQYSLQLTTYSNMKVFSFRHETIIEIFQSVVPSISKVFTVSLRHPNAWKTYLLVHASLKSVSISRLDHRKDRAHRNRYVLSTSKYETLSKNCSTLGCLTGSLRASGKVRMAAVTQQDNPMSSTDPGRYWISIADLPIQTLLGLSHSGGNLRIQIAD
jgi:hypothetical protein